MADSVLVAYATRYGSTQQVAEAIAETLREQGLEVDTRSMRQVHKLAGYRAVVLGAPLYMFRWHKDARRFLSRHRYTLTERPVAIFALGPFTTGDEKEWESSHEQLDKELSEFPWLTPVTLEVFGGKFDPARIRFPHKLFMHQVPAIDLRDWMAIRAWASNLNVKLGSVSSSLSAFA